MKEKTALSKTTIIKAVAFVIFLGVSIGLTIFTVPLIKNLLTDEGRAIIQQKVENAGIFGWLMFLGLQFLQVVVALIPGEPIEIIGGVLFGTFGGMFLCLLGIFLGTTAVYFLVKSFGLPLVYAFVSKEKLQSLKLFKDEKKLDILIFLLFCIPGTPKDALTYLVPLTPVKPMRFFIISTLARIPSIITSTFAGSRLGTGNWVASALMFVLAAALGVGGILLKDKLMKKWESRHKKKGEKS